MMSPVLWVVLQFLVSAKAGLVNYVDGKANVALHEQALVEIPVQTGPRGHVELLLTPGSFLRLDENTTVSFDSTDLSDIRIRILRGEALIEAANVDKHFPIHVTTG